MSALGFADPVFQSQATFRAILSALGRPGSLVSAGDGLAPPAPLAPSAAAALLTLADYETPLWISPAFAASEVAAWLKFHTGAPSAALPKTAAFALVDLARDALDLAGFAAGTAEYPDRSTTVIAQVASLSSAGPLRLSGPGVHGEARFGFAPCPEAFFAQWSANRAGFPLGVDLIFAAGTRLAALPRSTRLRGDA
jgi:alpha-D-ribose 1-methylphosphonate 5-triphosphate synthase subunit PhnH